MPTPTYCSFVPVMPAGTSSPDEISNTIVSVCNNGFPGIQSSDGLACCVTECGQCGEVGCSTIGLPDHGAEDCCSTEIVENGVSCGDTSEAPCYLAGEVECGDPEYVLKFSN